MAHYTWAAAMNGAATSSSKPSYVQGVCPTGWHLPSDVEWAELETYLGGIDVAGGKMKEAGTTHWVSPNTGATNESGFLPTRGVYETTKLGYFIIFRMLEISGVQQRLLLRMVAIFG